MREDGEYTAPEIEEPIAHTRQDGETQSLKVHLRNTAEMAARFADSFEVRAWGRAVGILHDDGKALRPFQMRIRKLASGEAAERVDHSTPGAKFASEYLNTPQGAGKIIAYCVAGHHAGLPDGSSGVDESCLAKRLGRSNAGPGFLSAEIGQLEPLPFLRLGPDIERIGFSAAFFIRMLFSCLVDADFLDTEGFVNQETATKRGQYPGLSELRSLLDTHLAALSAKATPSHVNKLRGDILSDCRNAAGMAPGLFSLTVPTGGGKTLSSLAFALDHALRNGMERVIYVIPYTSIIEQTAAVFRTILGDDAVLEHHSNFIVDRDKGDEELEERRRLASENWDAPIVVTTNVQFFECFFANRSSRTRRLHNVARSVVILDEAQMLPVPFLKPTIEVIRELSLHYHASVVLCTATQPALNVNDDFKSGLQNVREMIGRPEDLESAFQRVNPTLLGAVPDSDIAGRLLKEHQVLCIVNTRAKARKLSDLLSPSDDHFHLSALMCPVHRKIALEKIRSRLSNGLPCRVVSTQLVEAGVDVDFPVVYRAMAGIDSIVQAAGRCNREGRIAEGGRLYVFMPEDGLPKGVFRQNAQITELVLRGHEQEIVSSRTVRAFFRELYWIKDQGDGLDAEKILPKLKNGTGSGDFPFKSIAQLYKLIPDAQMPLIVPFDNHAQDLLHALRYSEYPGSLLRQLQPYTVQLYPYMMKVLEETGYVEIVRDEYRILTDLGMKEVYDKDFGLNPKPELKAFYEIDNLIID